LKGKRNTTLSIRTKKYASALVFLVAIWRVIPVFYLESTTWILTAMMIKVENEGFTLEVG
jgi:hypothetical protein